MGEKLHKSFISDIFHSVLEVEGWRKKDRCKKKELNVDNCRLAMKRKSFPPPTFLARHTDAHTKNLFHSAHISLLLRPLSPLSRPFENFVHFVL